MDETASSVRVASKLSYAQQGDTPHMMQQGESTKFKVPTVMIAADAQVHSAGSLGAQHSVHGVAHREWIACEGVVAHRGCPPLSETPLQRLGRSRCSVCELRWIADITLVAMLDSPLNWLLHMNLTSWDPSVSRSTVNKIEAPQWTPH